MTDAEEAAAPWRRASRRFARDRVALAALAALIALCAFCFIGPLVAATDFDAIYPDYVRAKPSLTAHPTEAEARAALSYVARRMRAEVGEADFDAGGVHVTLRAAHPIDARGIVYFERSAAFAKANILATRDDGRLLEVSAAFRPLWLPFGADANGRDLMTRAMIAGRISLIVCLLGCAVALLIGVAYGAVAGFVGGKVDLAMMRLVDSLYALPFIFFVILLTVFLGRRFALIFIAIGAVEWLDMARIVRGETLSLKRREFVVAARALGVSTSAILWRHVAPNLAAVVAAYLSLLAPRVILLESFLSFLGLGVQEPLTSLGVLIADGARNIENAPWLLALPSALLVAILYALNFVGEGLRAALDPKAR